MIWHSSTPIQVLNELEVDDKKGLPNGIVDIRLADYGENTVSKIEKKSFFSCFKNQLKSKTVISLIIIAIISMIVSALYNQFDNLSPLLIIAIVLINSLISSYYVYSSDMTIDNMKSYTNPNANVLRDGIVKNINSSQLVPGDILILEAGDYIPADARIIEASEFRCNESILSGIDVPVEKNADVVLEEITTVSERFNMVFSGTNVVHGSAKVVVTSTGLNTETGRTSVILQETGENKLPLETQLTTINKVINYAILGICFLTFIISLIQNFTAQGFASMTIEILLNSVALAVAAIPEGLPAITAIVIAVGIQRILRDKIIVKDPSAAELLGKTDVICCDKTGILTHNKMTVSKIFDGKNIIDVENEGVSETASIILKLATACSTLNNDFTEKAIEQACLTYNSLSKQDIEAVFPHICEIPFDSERKTMTVITMINERPFAIIKGALESIIDNCVDCDREFISKVNDEFANNALRNIAIAIKQLDSIPANPKAQDIENNMTFVGLLAIDDPPRSSVVDDIKSCDDAGIKVIMITGDNLSTAKTIARRIGILKDNTIAITGSELDELSDEELVEKIEDISVYARVSPNHKLRIVKAWQTKEKIVTITGDNLADAEALALADVGCTVGKFGADVAKGNSDIIIQNSNFSSIVRAVKESRGLFSNLKKSIYYLFSCNLAEILTVIFGLLIFGAMPVSAVLLLWINLLTDSAPAMSLSMENAEDDIMQKPHSSTIAKIFDIKSVGILVLQSIVISCVTLISYSFGYDFGDSKTAMTMAFATLSLSQVFHCFNNKFSGLIVLKRVFSNSFMKYSLGIVSFIILFLIFTPAGFLFGMNILTFKQFLISFVLSILIVPITQLIKFLMKIKKGRTV